MGKRIIWRRATSHPDLAGPQRPEESEFMFRQRQWKNTVGFVLFSSPNYNARDGEDSQRMEGESEGQWLARIALRAQQADRQLQGCEYCAIVDETELPLKPHFKGPPRKLFRESWRWDGARVACDMEKCREIKLEELRMERNNRLKASDVDKQRLDDIGTPQQKAALAAYRQQLRDLPVSVSVDLAKVADALALDRYVPAWPVKPV